MRDVVYLLLTAGFFGLTTMFVAACDRIVGPDPSDGAIEGGIRGVADAGHGTDAGEADKALQLGVNA